MKTKKVLKIALCIFLLMSFASTLYAEEDTCASDFASDFFVMPSVSVYWGKPEDFSFDLGADFLFPSILGFPYSYGLYALGGLGNGSDITNIRASTGLSLQNDYVGLKVGIGGDFSLKLKNTVTHDPFFFTEAILRVWFFEFKVIYDFNTDGAYNIPIPFNNIDPAYKQNPKYYFGINIIMGIAHFLMMGM